MQFLRNHLFPFLLAPTFYGGNHVLAPDTKSCSKTFLINATLLANSSFVRGSIGYTAVYFPLILYLEISVTTFHTEFFNRKLQRPEMKSNAMTF